MSTRCRLCTHPDRAKLEKLYLQSAATLEDVAEQASSDELTVSISSCWRHFRHHVARPDEAGGEAWRILGEARNGAKYQAFVEALLGDSEFCLTKAAKAVGYSAKTAGQAGWRLLKNVDVRRALAERIRERREACEVDQETVLKQLLAIGTSDARDVAYWNGEKVRFVDAGDVGDRAAAAISEVSETKDGVRIKFHPKVPALEKLAAHLGMTTHRADFTVSEVNTLAERMADALADVLSEETEEVRARVSEKVSALWARLSQGD